ncbi:MAG: hypothetical protein FWD12_12890, partial [Alphaproteobacteria bacterium]|nr:hypothetical protein [Alphaproteobacteria bacterium]
MLRAPPSSLLPILLLLARAAPAAPDAEEAHRQMGEAERARAANLEAQKAASVRAKSAQAEARRLEAERVVAAQRLRETELAATAASARMQALERERAETEKRLRARADSLAPLLPVIERLSLYPAETLLAVDAAPDDALRGALVLQGFGRMLEQQARSLRAEQAHRDAIRAA